MKNISDFLKKFKIIPDPSKEKERITQVIFEKTGIKIEVADVQVKKEIVYLSCHSAIKSALYIKKALILKGLSEMVPPLVIEDIR